MRKIYLFNLVTLEGFFEGQRKWDVAWHNAMMNSGSSQ